MTESSEITQARDVADAAWRKMRAFGMHNISVLECIADKQYDEFCEARRLWIEAVEKRDAAINEGRVS